MGVWSNFLEKLFKTDDSGTVVSSTFVDADSTSESFWSYLLALNIVCERYASQIGKCEFKTYRNGKFTKDDTWYMLNVEPNPYQTAVEFRRDILKNLIINPDHEALIIVRKINGKQTMFVASSFLKHSVGMMGMTFDSIIVTLPSGEDVSIHGTLSGDDVIYIKYVNTELGAIFNSMQAMYDELIENAKKAGTYRQKYIVTIDQQAQSAPNFKKYMQELLNEQFSAYIKGDNAVIPLYSGMKVDQTSAGADLGQNASIANKSVNEQLSNIITKIGLVFNIPESVMLGKYESEDLEQMLIYCIDPMADLITQAFNRSLYGSRAYIGGTYCRMDTENARHWDMISVSNAANKAVSSGVYSINEVRSKSGEEPMDSSLGDLHFVTRNYAVLNEEYINNPDVNVFEEKQLGQDGKKQENSGND